MHYILLRKRKSSPEFEQLNRTLSLPPSLLRTRHVLRSEFTWTGMERNAFPFKKALFFPGFLLLFYTVFFTYFSFFSISKLFSPFPVFGFFETFQSVSFFMTLDLSTFKWVLNVIVWNSFNAIHELFQGLFEPPF